MRSLKLGRLPKKMVCGLFDAVKALLRGKIWKIPSLPEALAENCQHIVPSGGNPEMLVRCQPEPLNKGLYYHDGRAIELVQKPKANRINVAFVRDLTSNMCYLVDWHKISKLPKVV